MDFFLPMTTIPDSAVLSSSVTAPGNPTLGSNREKPCRGAVAVEKSQELVDLCGPPSANGIGIGFNENATQRRENSFLVQVNSSVSSIWRGDEWSTIDFYVKLDRSFLSSATNTTVGGYHLYPCIERKEGAGVGAKHGRIPLMSDETVNMVTFKFSHSGQECSRRSVASVGTDPYNTLKVRVHRDLFADGEVFIVRVDAVAVGGDGTSDGIGGDEGCDEHIFGRSEPIFVADTALSIMERFSDDRAVERERDEGGGGSSPSVFNWYSKSGGGHSGLEVRIQLRDALGRTTPWTSESRLPLRPELLYDDLTPAPLWPLDAKKIVSGGADKSATRQQQQLFRLLGKDPVIDPFCDAIDFSFRIEEVSFHHAAQGFKLKVSAPGSNVHPAVLQETIVVKSKPKKDEASKKRRAKSASSSVDDSTSQPNRIRRRVTTAGLDGHDVDDCANDWLGFFHDQFDELDSDPVLDNILPELPDPIPMGSHMLPVPPVTGLSGVFEDEEHCISPPGGNIPLKLIAHV